MGFDPNTSKESGGGIEFISKYFAPKEDMKLYQPDLLIMRHVLEHLEDPADFLEQLALASISMDKPVYFFAETPCVDLAIESGRIVDFFYEHPSQFTKKSFTKLMKLGGDVKSINTDYGDEVVNGLVRLSLGDDMVTQFEQTKKFFKHTAKNTKNISAELEKLSSSEQKVVIWGGTGKAATFIQHYGLDREKFPYVVDSDPDKVGTFVPGTGQEIRASSDLQIIPADIIIIPTQWRAADIYAEINSKNISYSKIIIEYDGQLIDYERHEHPYKAATWKPDLGYAGAKARMLYQPDRSKASEPKRLLKQLPDLLQTTTQIATFKAGDKRKTLHQHLFLPKDYSGSPTVSLYTPWTEAEVHSHLTAGWGSDAISDLKLEYLYGPEAEVSGEWDR